MHSDIQWFLGLLVIIGIMAYTGWSTRKDGAFFGQATSTVLSVQTVAPPQPSSPSPQRPGQGRPPPQALSPTPVDPNVAPLRGRLSIASVARGSDAGGEYVRIQAARENTMPVAITGLQLRSAVTHVGAKIPRAWRLPFPGRGDEGEAVSLAPGGVAYVVTGRSLNGLSFQLNKCTGYLAQTRNFSPPIPRECPAPITEPLPLPPNHLSDTCVDFIAAIPSCTVPSSIPLHLTGDGSCQAHVFGKINYTTCVSLHKNEPDFYRNDWRLYLGRDGGLWRERRETIELLDQNGRLISSYSY